MRTEPAGRAEAALLGWRGPAVPVRLFGLSALAVFRLDRAEHARRRVAGPPPATDPGLLHCLLETGALGQEPPLRLLGLVVTARTWRGASRRAAALGAFGPVAAVVPEGECGPRAALDADMSGLGLVARDDRGRLRLVVPPVAPARPAIPVPVERLVQETVYAAALRPVSRGPGRRHQHVPA